MQRVLIVSMRMPYPLLSGYQVTMFNYLLALQQMGYTIDLFCVDHGKNHNLNKVIQELQEKIPAIKRISVCVIPDTISAIAVLLGTIFMLPAQVSYFSNFYSRFYFNRFIKNQSYKETILHSSRLTRIVPEKHLEKCIAFFFDSLSLNFHSRFTKDNSVIKNLAYKTEAILLERYEKRIAGKVKCSVFHNQFDIDFLGIKAKTHIIPVLKPTVPDFVPISASTKKRFIFIGQLSYKPNFDAIQYLIGLFQNNSAVSFQIDIIGSNLDEKLKRQIAASKVLRYLGPVVDASSEILDSYGILSPIFSGSGMTNKILDAFVHGRPAVASGFSAKPYCNILKISTEKTGILDFTNESEFVNILEKLTTDIQYANQVGLLSLQSGRVFSLEKLPEYLGRIFSV